ncbi:MAG TPA: secretin and TonB N-terminal domain-containing protein [Candidatus Cloacimonadota bacterium]|nr:secretin and TonB N-terminal domain-containing protein [Candidatus Cloacimonadota bacterium]
MKKFNFRKKAIISVLFLFLVFSAGLFAQENVNELLNKKISLDAEDASVSFIISTMARLSDCNIVLAIGITDTDSDTAEQKITIHIKDVPIEQALALVVKSIGLSYRLIGEKTFLVGTKDRIEEEIGERSYIITLNYVDVEKIVEALSIMPGQAVPIVGQNAILLRANPESFAEISKRIEEIDIPQKQIEIRARLIEISVSEAQKYGIDWSRINQLTTILAEDPVSSTGAGLPYNFTDDTGTTAYGDASELGALPDDQYFQRMDDLEDAFHFSRQLYAFDVTIDWLLENNAAQLLTDTRITALNGEEAEIHIGEVVPFVVEDDENTVQVEREDVGIKLKIKPNVNKDGQITTKIEPEVSSVIELVGGYVPRTKVRRVTSTVTVPDGKRIIVGGLLNSNIVTTVSKVPLLGDIPFIGKLFQHKVNSVDNTDLIIEITPHVVTISDWDVDFEVDERLERKLIQQKNTDESQE